MTSTQNIGSTLQSSPHPQVAPARNSSRGDEARKSDAESFSRSTRRAEAEARADARTQAKREAEDRRAAAAREADAPESKPTDTATLPSTAETPSEAPTATATEPRERSTDAPTKSKGPDSPHTKSAENTTESDVVKTVRAKLPTLGEALVPATKSSTPDASKTVASAGQPFVVPELPTLQPLAIAKSTASLDTTATDAVPSAATPNAARETAPLPTAATTTPSRTATPPAFVVPQNDASVIAKDAPVVEHAKAPVPVHAQERAHDILNQLRVHVSMGTRDALVQLHPIELGRISIRISTEGGRVRADVRAEKVETLDALQRHLPELRASFAQQGLDAQEFQLSLGFQNGAREEWRGDSTRAPQSKKTAENSLNPLNNTPLIRAIASESSIDTFA